MSSPVRAMFARIAGVYDLLNHLLSFGIDRSWRRELAGIAPPGVILDLAAGTLDVSIALGEALPDTKILAMDFCLPMLERGRRKLAALSPELSVVPCCADAFALPLPDSCVDGITMAFGIRNIRPRPEAFAEMLRVLRPGGRACILEFGSAKERILGGLYNFYLAAMLPLAGRMISRDKAAYSYLSRSIREFPPADLLAAEMGQAGFADVGYRKLTGGIVCLHWGAKVN